MALDCDSTSGLSVSTWINSIPAFTPFKKEKKTKQNHVDAPGLSDWLGNERGKRDQKYAGFLMWITSE